MLPGSRAGSGRVNTPCLVHLASPQRSGRPPVSLHLLHTALAPVPPPSIPAQGFLYVLDSNGLTRPGFPLQMGDIQVWPQAECLGGLRCGCTVDSLAAAPAVSGAFASASHALRCDPRESVSRSLPAQAQVAVADVNNDGKLELVAGDSRGNLAVSGAQTTMETLVCWLLIGVQGSSSWTQHGWGHCSLGWRHPAQDTHAMQSMPLVAAA